MRAFNTVLFEVEQTSLCTKMKIATRKLGAAYLVTICFSLLTWIGKEPCEDCTTTLRQVLGNVAVSQNHGLHMQLLVGSIRILLLSYCEMQLCFIVLMMVK